MGHLWNTFLWLVCWHTSYQCIYGRDTDLILMSSMGQRGDSRVPKVLVSAWLVGFDSFFFQLTITIFNSAVAILSCTAVTQPPPHVDLEITGWQTAVLWLFSLERQMKTHPLFRVKEMYNEMEPVPLVNTFQSLLDNEMAFLLKICWTVTNPGQAWKPLDASRGLLGILHWLNSKEWAIRCCKGGV